MNNKFIKLTNWPFKNNEKAKLVWIGEPFSQNKKWVVKVYFRSIIKRETKVIIVDWPTIHFLSVGKTYCDGIINQSECEEDSKIIDINLDGIEAIYNEREWYIHGTNEKGVSRTFNFKKEKNLYIIPSIEIIRGILGIDSFTLRLLLSIDAIENYFTYEIESNVLKLYFTNEYNTKLLTKEKLCHIAWILTNINVLKMFNEISNSYSIGGLKNFKFNFHLDTLNLKARIKQKENRIFIQELLELKNKKINVREIQVEHPMLSSIQVVGSPKRREFITYTHSKHEEIQLETKIDGASKGLDLIKSNQIIHYYDISPVIFKNGLEKEYRRIQGDENTKQYFHDDKGKRTLGDIEGERKLKGLEFVKPQDVHITGELNEFIQIIKLLERKSDIEKIDVLIDNLPIGNGGKFARLDDEYTPRKYIFCKIIMKDNRERMLIEVERENKALSTLILKADREQIWERICIELLIGVIKNHGSWDKNNTDKFTMMGIDIIRKRHNSMTLMNNCNIIHKYITTNGC